MLATWLRLLPTMWAMSSGLRLMLVGKRVIAARLFHRR